MKIHLLLLLLVSIASCMKQSEDSKESNVSSHSTVKQIHKAEIEAINSKMNNNPQYRLTQDEYETLIASGHFSELEKAELKQLFQ